MAAIARVPGPDLIALVERLGGKWVGRTAMCLCPVHEDRTPSLALRQGDRGVLVTCFAGCDRRAIVRALRIPAEARIGRSCDVHLPPSPFMRIWDQSRPIQGTLAEHYLRSVRGITCSLADLRFHARCPRGRAHEVVYEPALVAALRKDGALVAIQRIFLDEHARASGRKLCLGSAKGAVWTNGTDMAASAQGVVALCEGLETAAAFTSITQITAWATMGAMQFDAVVIPQQVSQLILLPDNDEAGRQACRRALRTYSRPGLAVSTIWPPMACNDWADVLAARKR